MLMFKSDVVIKKNVALHSYPNIRSNNLHNKAIWKKASHKFVTNVSATWRLKLQQLMQIYKSVNRRQYRPLVYLMFVIHIYYK
jgi:hypothetical protein